MVSWKESEFVVKDSQIGLYSRSSVKDMKFLLLVLSQRALWMANRPAYLW
ncbi:unnamed protein product [Staurois parvus]|uniref:Uncharacterized protein n=1 Tax=Staurois parvus TaxID=386267 RepID=A0ABN9CQG3_9NEOB|nr:unnamed protein product [Staurois parvus]